MLMTELLCLHLPRNPTSAISLRSSILHHQEDSVALLDFIASALPASAPS